MAPIKWNRIFEKIQNKSGKEKITIVVLTGILLLVISLPTVQSPDRQKRMKIHRPGRPDCQKAQKATKRCWKKNWKKH